MGAVIAVAISGDINLPELISKKLDAMLQNIDDFEIVAINDKNKIIENYAGIRNCKVTQKTYNNRVGARQALTNATHAVVFWTGHDLNEIIFVATLNKIPIKISPISITTVVNKDSGQPYDIYIGRGSPLGNRFAIDHKTDVGRTEVIERYREYFYKEIVPDPGMRKYLESLRGLKLGCHCKPLACHGDIIADYLNNKLI